MDVFKKLQALGGLARGWNFGEGEVATPECFRVARWIVHQLLAAGAKTLNIFPLVEGGVIVVSYEGNDEHIFSIYNVGRIVYVKEEDGESESEEVDVRDKAQLFALIRLAVAGKCTSFFSTFGFSMRSKSGSEARASKTHQIKAESLWSIGSVPYQRAVTLEHTPESFTQPSPASQRFTYRSNLERSIPRQLSPRH